MVVSGCGAEIGALPGDDVRYGFVGSADATPEVLQPGQVVNFQVHLTSVSNAAVLTDVTLRLVALGTGKVELTQTWRGVRFEPEQVYELRHTFLSATDTGRVVHRVEIEVRDAETGEQLYLAPDVTHVEFGTPR